MAKMPVGYVQTSFRLPPDLLKQFKLTLVTNGDTAQEVLTNAVIAYIELNNKANPEQ